MTENEKQILLKDLCARLPYNVIVSKSVYGHDPELYYLDLYKLAELRDGDPVIIKPCLRPMSSMTEEEEMEVKKFGVCYDKAFHNDIYDTGISMEEAFIAISWFLERHFDINYLIEKGLALEAPEGMYKTE